MATSEWIFWGCAAAVVYAYAGYNALLRILGYSLGPIESEKFAPASDLPMVTILVAAHNEDRVIQQRIRNLLNQDYPSEKVEIFVASDGSSDRTVGLASEFETDGIVVFDLPRMGKGPAQNEAIRKARGEI